MRNWRPSRPGCCFPASNYTGFPQVLFLTTLPQLRLRRYTDLANGRNYLNAAWRQCWRPQPSQDGGAPSTLRTAGDARSTHVRAEWQRGLQGERAGLAATDEAA